RLYAAVRNTPFDPEWHARGAVWSAGRDAPRGGCDGEHGEQPVVKLRLHSAGDASPLTALLLPHIFPICSVVAPCQRGASPPSVRRWTFTTGCSVRRCWQPVVKVWLHSTGDASSRAALLLPQILPVLHPT